MNENKAVKKESGWRYVFFGELPGVLMGVAGTVMAADYLRAQPKDDQPVLGGEETEVVPVAQVSDDMSFAEAFAVARAEVGAGGVFAWHGNVYNTFYKEEWEAMTDEQKEEFVENYRNTEVVVPEYETEEYALMDEEEGEVDDGDDEMEEEVEVLDVERVTFADGTEGSVAEIVLNGTDGLLVDTNDDGAADVMVLDVNADGEIENDFPDYMNDADTSTFA